MATLYIRGEIGATLDDERRTIASINAESARLRATILGAEEFTWKVTSENLTATDTIIPDEGQAVSVYIDEDRIFHGVVISQEIVEYGVIVKLAGPTWWLTRETATSTQADQEGGNQERPVLAFPEQGWDTSIEELIDLAENTFNLPVTIGTVAAFNDLPPLRYNLKSLADVLANIISWAADAVPWWDFSAHSGDAAAASATTITLAAGASAVDDAYNGREIEIRSGANAGESRVITDYDGSTKVATVASAWTTSPSAGDDYTVETKPALNVTRRGSATDVTYTLGTDPVISPLSFRPRSELEVERIELPYVSRDSETGKYAWASQSAGTAASGKRQIIPVAGPELADYLPDDNYETVSLDFTTTDVTTAAKAAVTNWDDLIATWPEGGTGWRFSAATVTTTRSVVRTDPEIPFPSPTTWTANALAAGRSFIAFDGGIDPPQWLIDDFGIQEYALNHWYFVDGNTASPTSPPFDSDRRAELIRVLGNTFYWQSGSKTDPSAFDGDYLWLLNYKPGARVWTIADADIPASGIFYRKRDFGYAFPPSGLAAAMLAAANWTPWEGTITRHLDGLTAETPFNAKYNISGSIAAASTAGALPKAYDYNFSDNTVTIELGPPARFDYQTLVRRIERRGEENLINL